MGEKSIMALAVINGRMTNLSVLQRLNNTVSGARYAFIKVASCMNRDYSFPLPPFDLSNIDGMLTPLSTPGQSRPPSVERSTESLSSIPYMSTPRCAVGAANLNNALFVCGNLFPFYFVMK